MGRRNKSGQLGTAAETAVVRAARTRGFPHADRLRLTGAWDRGDVCLTPTLVPGVIVEVKGGNAARNASDNLIEEWLAETAAGRENAGADYGFLVVQRSGVGYPNAHRWWAVWELGHLKELLAGEPTEKGTLETAPVRMTLDTSLHLLRVKGWGDPIHDHERE